MKAPSSKVSGGASLTGRRNGRRPRRWTSRIDWNAISGGIRRGSSPVSRTSAADVRIIAGQWRGRTIKAPRDDRVRPTGDRAREAWMSIVQPELAGGRGVELYPGPRAPWIEGPLPWAG